MSSCSPRDHRCPFCRGGGVEAPEDWRAILFVGNCAVQNSGLPVVPVPGGVTPSPTPAASAAPAPSLCVALPWERWHPAWRALGWSGLCSRFFVLLPPAWGSLCLTGSGGPSWASLCPSVLSGGARTLCMMRVGRWWWWWKNVGATPPSRASPARNGGSAPSWPAWAVASSSWWLSRPSWVAVCRISSPGQWGEWLEESSFWGVSDWLHSSCLPESQSNIENYVPVVYWDYYNWHLECSGEIDGMALVIDDQTQRFLPELLSHLESS